MTQKIPSVTFAFREGDETPTMVAVQLAANLFLKQPMTCLPTSEW